MPTAQMRKSLPQHAARSQPWGLPALEAEQTLGFDVDGDAPSTLAPAAAGASVGAVTLLLSTLSSEAVLSALTMDALQLLEDVCTPPAAQGIYSPTLPPHHSAPLDLTTRGPNIPPPVRTLACRARAPKMHHNPRAHHYSPPSCTCAFRGLHTSSSPAHKGHDMPRHHGTPLDSPPSLCICCPSPIDSAALSCSRHHA